MVNWLNIKKYRYL